jgi:2-dehydropantoate 2-reductase
LRIAIIGIGGVGAYIGASFLHSQVEHEITLVGRGEHKEAIISSGLKIIEDSDEFSVAVENMELSGVYDIVIFAVKSYDLADAVEMLRPNIDKKSILFSLANGVAHAKMIQESVDAKVLDATVYILSHIKEPGVIRKEGKVFSVVIGSKNYKEELLIIEKLFNEAHLRIKISENIEEALWKKYLFISVFATLTTYYDKSIKSVYEDQRKECEELIKELVAVAKAKGIDLHKDIEKALDTASKLPEKASSSMHLDFQNSHKNELETLTYYVIREGLELGVKTPLYEKMYKALKAK